MTSIDGVPWLIGDLHERNIMRDRNGAPTIIDALVSEITLTARRELGWLAIACEEALRFRETGARPPKWDEAVDDGML